MTKPTRTLTFGAVSWNNPRLVDSLYPHDAPASWWLPCYTAHFDTVLVPEADWQGVTAETADGWLRDLPSQFWFYLRVDAAPAAAQLDALALLCERLGERLGGVVVTARAADSLDAILARTGGAPVFADARHPGVERLWTGPDSACPCGHVGLIEWDQLPAPRELRAAVEGFLACQDEPWSVVFIEAPPATFDNARVIGQLLGVT